MIAMRARQIEQQLRAKRSRPMTDSEYRVHRARSQDSSDSAPAQGILVGLVLGVIVFIVGMKVFG